MTGISIFFSKARMRAYVLRRVESFSTPAYRRLTEDLQKTYRRLTEDTKLWFFLFLIKTKITPTPRRGDGGVRSNRVRVSTIFAISRVSRICCTNSNLKPIELYPHTTFTKKQPSASVKPTNQFTGLGSIVFGPSTGSARVTPLQNITESPQGRDSRAGC